jgi:large subunit GTPase 1
MQEGVTSIGMDVQEDRTRSVLEMNDLDDFLQQADLANRDFISEREGFVVLDQSGQAYRPSSVQWEDRKPDFVFTELSVPRRPAWDESTTPEELHIKEHNAFLDWRRAIAAREEELVRTQSSASVTPFEKNIEVWRQLWRVLERCSCLLQLVDARNPLFYLSADLKEYAESLGKPMMVLINKSDYLSTSQRAQWRDYLVNQGWNPVFFSATMEQKKIDEASQRQRRAQELRDVPLDNSEEKHVEEEEENEEDTSSGTENDEESKEYEEKADFPEQSVQSLGGQGVDFLLTREQLLETMLAFARQHNCQPDPKTSRIQFGMVGFPNVGKSSGEKTIFVHMKPQKRCNTFLQILCDLFSPFQLLMFWWEVASTLME